MPKRKAPLDSIEEVNRETEVHNSGSEIQSHDQSDHGTSASDSNTTQHGQQVKLEILPSTLQKSSTKDHNQSNSHFHNHGHAQIDASNVIESKNPPKMIMLPDSLRVSGVQKRRRVVRACDRCRKLKIKCSGDLPCIHCTVYNYECTYDQPNKSKRKNSSIPEARPAMNKFSKGASNMNLSLNFTQGSNAPHPNVIFKSVNTLARDKSDNASFQDSSSANTAHGNEVKNGTSMERFNSSTVSVLASSNPELFSKLTDRLKLYDDILHRLLPEIKLTDLNDNPKPINPMKLMTALNKMRDMGKSTSKSSSKQIAQMYDTLPDIPLPALPISKLPPNHFNRAAANVNTAIPLPGMNIENPIMSNNSNLPRVNSSDCTDPNNSPHQGIDGSLESSMGKEIKIILPPREVALDLITKTWENACVLFRFYHRVAFVEDLNELYDTDPNHYTNKQQRFLPLVYSVMACGALFYKSDENTNNNLDYNNNNDKSESEDGESPDVKPSSHNDFIQRKDFEDEGYKYFIAARKLIDITDTRDTYGIQTIVMLIIFLQCSARLSTCYAYIGIALRAALREGLHRKLDYPFNPIELEIRKRLFWTIYKMDIYANTMLGLPRTISSDDFDQDMPEELDDENITVNGYRYDRQGDRLSSSGIANAHTRLIFLMKEVVAKLYPIKPKKLVTTNNPNNHYRTISNASNHTGRNVSQSVNIGTDVNIGKQTTANEGTKSNVNVNVNVNDNGDATNVNKNDMLRNNFVYDLELKLQDWMNSLPLELKPGVEPPGQYLKANRLLHISYLHVKIILYRPFIHYISANVKSNSMNDLTCIEKAKTCINVARIVVKLAEDMINKNMLSGSYWFSIYTIFFSVACLVYYVHFAPSVTHDGKPDPEYMAIKKDAENGKRVLDILKDSSMAARRTYNILNALFEQLNRKTARAGSKSNLSGGNRDTQFVPAHMASNEYENEPKNQPGQADQHDHNKTPTEEPQKFQTSVQQFPYNPQYQAQPNRSSPQMSNIYNASGQPNYPAQLNMSATYSDGIPTFDNSTMNAYTDQFDTRGSVETGAVNTNNNANTPGQFNANDYYMTESHKKSSGSLNDITEYKYVPGFMDQMDMKIFGRFLPPYMLGNKNGGEGGQNADSISSGVNVDVNRTDNPNHVKNATTTTTTTTTSTAKDANANVNGADVFQPSMGLFNYVKNNGSPGESEVFKAEDEENAVESTEHVYQPNTVKSEGNGSGNGNPYIDSTNWLDSDLLESTNYFFNQVTKSNAIPSGLSTVFQSENDKNNATSTVEVRDVRDHNIDTNKSASETPQTIEVPSRFTSHEGVGMLDELLFGSAWDDADANKKATAAAGENVEVDNDKNERDT